MSTSRLTDARGPGRGRRRGLAAAFAAAVLIVGIGTNASAAPPKPPSGPAPSAPATSAPATSAPATGGVDAATAAASPASVHAPATTSSTPGSDGAAAASAPSTDAALRPVDLGALAADAKVSSGVRSDAAGKGSIPVIVTLDTTFQALGAQPSAAAADQRASVLSLSDAASAAAAANGGTVTRTYGGNIPAVAMTVTPAALDALAASPAVARVAPDRSWIAPTLSDTTPLIGAADAQDRGFHGANTEVAVMDTGVDYGHPFFGGRVAHAACFSSTGDCPNGQTSQIGGNAGIPCTFSSECCPRHPRGRHRRRRGRGHASSSTASANQAQDRVDPRVPPRHLYRIALCDGSDSDVLAGLNFAYDYRNIGTVAVNLSLGGGKYTGELRHGLRHDEDRDRQPPVGRGSRPWWLRGTAATPMPWPSRPASRPRRRSARPTSPTSSPATPTRVRRSTSMRPVCRVDSSWTGGTYGTRQRHVDGGAAGRRRHRGDEGVGLRPEPSTSRSTTWRTAASRSPTRSRT